MHGRTVAIVADWTDSFVLLDNSTLAAYMDSLIGDDYPFWLVIFPEGTTIHQEYVVKSQAFAEKYGSHSDSQS